MTPAEHRIPNTEHLPRYFDNAATTPLDPRVLEAMLPYLQEDFGNPNSLHSFGQKAQIAIENARQQVAELLNADDPSQITFTSGATESNNWIARNFPDAWVSPFEHSSLHEPANALGLNTLSNREHELCHLDKPASLVSVMAVNNETGTEWDVRAFRPVAEKLHSDLTQAVGKLQTSVEGLDYASFSAHKFYGPKGSGGLFIRDEPLPPLLLGGEQEGGLRGGTLNVPGIVGMGAAARIALEEQEQNHLHASELNALVLDALRDVSDWRVNGGGQRSPYILSISFLGVEGESLVIDADRRGFAISSGAACSSRSVEPSHVLMALELEENWRRGTVRISFGRHNTLDSTVNLAKSLGQTVEKLRTMT